MSEVEFGLFASDSYGSLVVGSGGIFGGVVGSKPNTVALVWVSNLGGPFAPWPPPDSSVFVFANSLHLLLFPCFKFFRLLTFH